MCFWWLFVVVNICYFCDCGSASSHLIQVGDTVGFPRLNLLEQRGVLALQVVVVLLVLLHIRLECGLRFA